MGDVRDGTFSDGTVAGRVTGDGAISDGAISDGAISDGAISDGERVAASLAAWIDGLSFVDLGAEDVTALLVDAVAAWGTAQGWRVYRRAASVMKLPAPYQHLHSCVDVACARPAAVPVVIEVDRSDRRRSVDKLLAESAAGRVALWVRWGNGRLAVPPPPVRMVPCPVTTRTGLGDRGRLHSHRPATDRPAPRHSLGCAPTTGAEEQAELFTGDQRRQGSAETLSEPSA